MYVVQQNVKVQAEVPLICGKAVASSIYTLSISTTTRAATKAAQDACYLIELQA